MHEMSKAKLRLASMPLKYGVVAYRLLGRDIIENEQVHCRGRMLKGT
jgi:hypothetical protein